MNEQLQTIMDFIQQNETISAEEKSMLLKDIKKVSSDLEIAVFKLERTEKVKRTTAILLEETIEELEQKRKAVEAQNRDLEIESSLERVRTVAMGMRKPDDMLEVCRIISQQSESLGIKEIRNVQTAIIYENKGTYLNYEYYAKHEKLLVTEVDYKNHELQTLFANRMLQGAEELFASALTGKEIQEWYEYQKTTNQFADSYLENAQSLNYYFYSLGPVALGISTYSPLSEEEIGLFKRFRNVFDLAYRRFLDIEQAEAQAREAKIEASLERLRAQALSMRKPDDLPGICEVLFTELTTLGLAEIRNAMINIHDDEKASFVNYDYSDEIGRSINHLDYNIHPIIEKQVKQVRSAGNAFSETSFTGKDLEDWKVFRKNIGEKDDPRIENADALYYYFYSIGTGSIGISTFSSITEEKLNVLKRFRNVFDFAYRRYTDVAQAEAQAREAQIEAALERVRSRTMGMQKSEELKEVIKIIYQQLIQLKINLDHAGFVVDYEPKGDWHFWIADEQDIPSEITHPYFESVWANQFNEAKVKGADIFVTNLNFEEKNKFYQELLSYIPGLPETSKAFYLSCPGLAATTVLFNNVGLYIENFSHIPYTDEENTILMRFGKVFQQTYTRFLDLQKAEAQAREAQIEAALEKIRSSALAMQTSQQLKDVASELRNQMRVLGQEDLEVCAINLYEVDENYFESWGAIRTRNGNEQLFEGNARFPKSGVKIVDEMMQNYNQGTRDYVLINEKEKAREWIGVLKEYSPEAFEMIKETIALQKTEDLKVYWSLADFDGGAILMVTYSEPDDSSRELLRRTANVFELAYRRFHDLKTAEAHTEKAKLDLIQIQTEKKRAEEALAELQATQKQLIQSEKMASLGELTAGIAHEIQNPLNFVNNFSEVSSELLDEMKLELDRGDAEEAKAIASDVKLNLEKILHHGKRADAIVKGMLQHSRSSSGVKEPTDINALADEYLRLAYHGLRAKDKSFNATLKTDFDESIGKIDIIPQDMGRVILNLITNAFYAVTEKKMQLGSGFEPTISVSTIKSNGNVKIKVADNGNGIPQKVLDKIFQPFFTTKPTGQGTGLGLSLAYDIVKAHGGELKVETNEGEGSSFIIVIS